jgi:hypothetical protein
MAEVKKYIEGRWEYVKDLSINQVIVKLPK